ncbi:hypothetical protein [Streptomyces sp. NRRL F-5123]|uniref:hypothetical protein n=1 Tax=Streptomyces sp. NRRL F-5123 TaxID=1463856 RepID=UPI0004E2707C|nr:hypothetical protein [Streptomyces sp. NRRL F-5123]
MSDHRDGGQYGYGPGPGQGDAQGRGHDERAHGAAPYPADGAYVPEPLPSGPHPYADQGTPFGAPPPGDDWSAHTAGPDGTAYGSPGYGASGDGWGATPPSAHPWNAPQPPYTEAAPGYGTAQPPYADGGPGYVTPDPAPGYGTAAYGADPAPGYGTPPGYDPAAPGQVLGHGPLGYDATGVDTGAPWQSQPHEQTAPHAYAAGPAEAEPYAAEHTAVLPTVPGADGADGAAPGPRAARRGGPAPVRPDGRTGSPIIAPGIQPAALTAGLGLLLAGGAAVGKPGLAVVLVLLQAVTAAGWFRLNGMWPARQGIVLAFLAGVTADIGMLAADGDHAPAVVLGTLGVWLLLVLVLQLRHHGSADERLSSLTATSASTLITVLACGYLATQVSDAGHGPVVAGAVAVAAAALVRALPLPGEPVSLGAALLAAAATGALTGPAGDLGAGKGVLLAVAAGACALVGLRVASYDFPSRFVHFTAGVALPLTAAAPVVYALGRALT